MSFTGINHVAFATGDMNETIRFWRDLLGLKLVASIGDDNSRQYFFALTPHSFISFFEWPGVEKVGLKRPGEPVTGPFNFDHVAIGMESGDDLLRLQSILDREDYPVSDIVDHGFVHSIYTYDPNGIPLEFNRMVPEADVVEHPVFADVNPPEEATRGPNPSSELDRSIDPSLEYFVVEGEGAKEFGPDALKSNK